MATTIIDYGIGNLRSIEKALEQVDAMPERTDDPERITAAERLVLPGVGAFGACIGEIRRRGLEAPIQTAVDEGTPLLGVCVGMQLLFEESTERGTHTGLGLLEGRVVHFHTETPASSAPPRKPDAQEAAPPSGPQHGTAPAKPAFKVPHMGWNTAEPTRPSPLLQGLGEAAYFYFVHSYHVRPVHHGDTLATTAYGHAFPAMVERNNVFGVQFHPEKSQQAGLRLLKNFATLSVRDR